MNEPNKEQKFRTGIETGAKNTESQISVEIEPTQAEKEKSQPESKSSFSEKIQNKIPFIKRKTPQHILPPIRDEVTMKIEKILEENVGEAYSRLSPIAKQEFKLKGEATAEKIREALKGTHIKVKRIFQLILEWLKMLPGVNRFFLEQEAKIKTDRIIALHKKNNNF